MSLTANSDLFESEHDRAAARILRIHRLLVRRYKDENDDMTTNEREALTMELIELERRVGA